MNTVAILADTHIGCRSDNSNFHDYFEKFFLNIFIPYLKEHNIKHIIHVGDVFDRRKYINFVTLSKSRHYLFDELIKNDLTMDVIIGNHDTSLRYTNSINSPSLLLKEYPNIRIYENATEVKIFDKYNCLYVPWICNDNAEDSYKKIKKSKSSYVFGHLELQGFEHYKGHVAQEGENPELFSKYSHVFSGHFHHRSHRDNIYYLGTPYQMTWQDYGTKKGFHLFNFDNNELTFIENPYDIYSKIYYDDLNYSFEYYAEMNLEKYKNQYVRIIVEKKNNPFCFEMFFDRMEKNECYEISIVEDVIVYDDQDISEDKLLTTEETPDIIKKYVSNLDIDYTEKLEKVMLDLHTEAINL